MFDSSRALSLTEEERYDLHAGTWFSDDPALLRNQITDWLSSSGVSPKKNLKFLISPHAGLTYCGKTMGHGFSTIPVESITRVVLMGPSHRAFIRGIEQSPFKKWTCPLGSVPVSEVPGIAKAKMIDCIHEHSLLMQLPFIVHLFQGRDITISPMYVGSEVGTRDLKHLRPLIRDPSVLFVISSDFCHYGQRFGYTPSVSSPIWQGIEHMDQEGVRAIQRGSSEFASYLRRTQNTICGRGPILTLLRLLELSGRPFSLELLHYSQSDRAKGPSDCSVSYVSAAGVLE
eukprot:gnl/Dysnectes_brevis/2368_a2797_1637.p1 GENE.gnl/Dysnectes_brevis/2368_a2797_1637~~gnl/Dysnectes_brevis/2368_a2797_1637.p1  ORF type:complete len:287 (-),score=67.65 gnl/Dysnectes_brevis/2368_a2797_1637:31-891(-)